MPKSGFVFQLITDDTSRRKKKTKNHSVDSEAKHQTPIFYIVLFHVQFLD